MQYSYEHETDDWIPQLMTQYADMVYRLAFARCGNRADTEDVFQEVFLRLVRRKPRFESEEHAKAWLLRVTINCCNDQLRFWHRPQPEPPPQFESEDSLELHQALAALRPKQRTLLHLFYFEDLTTDQIAELMHAKPATVRTWLTRARAALKNLLQPPPRKEL